MSHPASRSHGPLVPILGIIFLGSGLGGIAAAEPDRARATPPPRAKPRPARAKQRPAPVSRPSPAGRNTSRQVPADARDTTHQQRPVPTRLHILFHTDLAGRYRWPGCRKPPQGKADYAQLLSAVTSLRRDIEHKGEAVVLVSAGNHLGPDIFGQFFAGRSHQGLTLLSTLLRVAHYDAVLLARQDLASSKSRQYVETMTRSRIPLLKGNLTCKNRHDPRCTKTADSRRPFLLVKRGGLRIAILGLLPDDLDSMLRPSRHKGLAVDPSETWLTKALKRIRNQHMADLVILLSDMDTSYSAPRRILRLLRRLGRLAPDVTVSNSLYDSPSGSGSITMVRRSDGRLVLSSGRFGQFLGHLVLDLRKESVDRRITVVTAKMLPIAKFAPMPRQERLLEHMMHRLCRKLDVPLGQGRIRRPMSRSDFIRYSLEIIRRRTHAELAILPDSLFSEAGFPLTGVMTKEKIRRAIRTEDMVGKMVVKGSWLKKHLTQYLSGDRPRLWVAGLTKKGTLYYVNGRVLQPDIHYGVATTDFTVQGGEGLIPKPKIFLPLRRHKTLRQVFETFFAKNEYRRKKSDLFIDLAANFVPLRDKFLLFTTMNMNLALTDVSILHPGLYTDQPQLNRERLTGITVNASVMGMAENSTHSIKATASLKYGKARTWVTNDLTGIDEKTTLETDDLVSLAFLYKYRRLHSRFDPKRWYYPVPFVETSIETELTKNLVAKSGKVYRYTETAGILGIGLRLYPKLFAKVGFVSRSHNLLVPEERLAERGLYLGMDLDRTALVAETRYKLYWESDLDFVFVRMLGLRVKELIWTNKLAFAFIDHLFFTINHEFYVYDTKGARVNLASNLTAGIQVLLDLRQQLN